jgi:alpha-glucosidase
VKFQRSIEGSYLSRFRVDADARWPVVLYLFDSSQPDLNWNSPDVAADFEQTCASGLTWELMRFRIDVFTGVKGRIFSSTTANPEHD